MKRKLIVCSIILLFTLLAVNMFSCRIEVVSMALLLVSIVIAHPIPKKKSSLAPGNVMSYAEWVVERQ